MVMTLFILVISSIIAFAFIPQLKKKKETKTIITFSVILILATAINIGIALKLKIPSPLDFITFIFSPIRDLIVSLTK